MRVCDEATQATQFFNFLEKRNRIEKEKKKRKKGKSWFYRRYRHFVANPHGCWVSA
jgi:hypothetical protein